MPEWSVPALLSISLITIAAGCRSVEYAVSASNVSQDTVSVRLLRNADKPDAAPQMEAVMGPGGRFEWAGPIRRGGNAAVAVRRYDSGKEVGDRAYIVLVPKGRVSADIDTDGGRVIIRNYESTSSAQ